MGMSLHPPQPLLPLHPISDKSPKQNGIVQPSSPVANLLASSSSSCAPLLLPPRPPVQPWYSCRCPCAYVCGCVCSPVRCPSDEHRRIDRAARAKEEQEERRKNENEGRSILPPLCMGPFMHAGHPSITWGENSPPATVPCVPCAPGSRESVSSHRYHTHILCSRLCLPLLALPLSCLCPFVPSCCPSRSVYPSTRLAGYFWSLWYLALDPFPPPPFAFSPRRGLVTCSSCTHRRGLAHPHQPPRLVRALLDATVPLAGPTRVLGFCDR